MTKESPRAQESEFHIAQSVRVQYRHYPAAGITKDHLLDPAYWAVLSRKLRPGDEIAAFAQDGTYYANLLVLSAERTYAKVHLLSYHALTTMDVAQTQADKFRVEYKGIKLKHCVVRLSDGEILHEGSQTKDDAVRWLNEREKQLTA